MRIPRIYCSNTLQPGGKITLNANAANHVLHVLRLQLGAKLILFNGMGGEYTATLIAIDKHKTVVQLEDLVSREVESPLTIHLVQAVARGEKMDYIVQKAVELGISKIIPIFTTRCNVKLDSARLVRRQQRWQAIAISACEQCGRNRIPQIEIPQQFTSWLSSSHSGTCLLLHHLARDGLANLSAVAACTLLVGPEGGLTSVEVEQVVHGGFMPIRFGPRILRTETAALAAISALQTRWGDLG